MMSRYLDMVDDPSHVKKLTLGARCSNWPRKSARS